MTRTPGPEFRGTTALNASGAENSFRVELGFPVGYSGREMQGKFGFHAI